MKKVLPLYGCRVLVGRARHQASALSTGLRKLGAEVVEIPFIEIRKPRSYKPLDAALRRLDQYDWLVLTSVNGVEAVGERLRELVISRGKLRRIRTAAIGPATKKAMEAQGMRVHVVPKEYVAESVVASLRSRIVGKRVLLARAKVARDVIPRELRRLGAEVDVVEAYETVIPAKSRQRIKTLMADPARRPDIITFTSSSTVRNFAALLRGPNTRGRVGRRLSSLLAGTRLASIGPVTSATLRELGLAPQIEARRYNIPGLIQAIAGEIRVGR
jgi:uroporphyrinogen-III synthase